MTRARAASTRRPGAKQIGWIAFVASLACSQNAHADNYYCGSGAVVQPTSTLNLAGTAITASANVPLYGWIGNWSSYQTTDRNWWCRVYTGVQVQVLVKRTGSLALPSPVTLDGASYAVFPTGVTGLGIVFRWHPRYNYADALPDVPLTADGNYSTAGVIWSFSGTSGAESNFGLSYQGRYVKIGEIPSGATFPALSGVEVARASDQYRNTPTDVWKNVTIFGFQEVVLSMTQPQTTFPVTGCTPAPTVSVTMGTYSTSAFTGVGSSAGARNFSIPLMNCPKGLGTILYSLHPVSGSVGPAADSVAQLTAGPGSATGLGIRITDASSDAPVGFDIAKPVTGYRVATGGNVDIQLKAAYYQTAARVGAGAANALIEFTIIYQ